MFPEAFLEDVRSANGIQEVIADYLALKKVGASWRGLCPFHSEKTPSFYVHPDKGIFHCFGCGAGGNVFTFLMRHDNATFPEAVKRLAERAGIPLPAPDPRAARRDEERRTVVGALAAAAEFYHRQLLESPEAQSVRDYLAARAVNGEGIERFRLGWSPSGWEALRNHLNRAGFNDDLLLKAGLVSPRKSGGCYDRFRSRLIFPIATAQGEVVAFGGRVIAAGEEPKYLNSPETEYYQKSRLLYALDLAKGAIRERGFAVVVEGYLDALTAHLAGIENVVATLGTALTREHLRLIRRFADRVVLVFDGDAAGIEAARRSLDLVLEEDLAVNSALLPDGHDPDSLIRAQGPEAFTRALTSSVPLMDFYLERTLAASRTDGVERKTRVVRELVPVLARIAGQVKRSEYIRKVARMLDIREDALEDEVRGQASAARPAAASPRVAPGAPRRRCVEEEELVRAMLHLQPLALKIRDVVPLPSYRDDTCRAVAAEVYASLDNGGWPPAALEDPAAAALAARLQVAAEGVENLEQVADDCLERLRRERLQQELAEVQAKIRSAETGHQAEVLDDLLRIKQSIART